MNYSQMDQYLSPEAAAELAGINDPEMEMLALNPMAQTAKGLQGIRPMERSNGRVVGATSPLEAIGAAGANIAGAYMNKQLMDKYGGIMGKNADARKGAARKIAGHYYADALRKSGTPDYAAQSYPVDPQSAAEMYPLEPF